jgi:hypothetical protein
MSLGEMGLSGEFFSGGRVTHVIEHYRKSRGVEIEVEVTLYDGETFLVSLVQVFGDDLVFQTEGEHLVLVSASGVAKVWVRPRDPARGRQPGFRVETPAGGESES